MQLGIGPAEIPYHGQRYTTIEVSAATPRTYIDVEVAPPKYRSKSGGACPKLTKGPCDLDYAGGGKTNADGYMHLKFPDDPKMKLYSGLYTITVRDRHTGQTVSIDLAVNV